MAGGGKGGRSGGRERKLSAKGLRIARRMRLQVPLPPEPKWKRKRTAAAMQAAIAEWKLERKPAPPAAKPQRKPGTAARPPRRRRSRATSISSRAGRRRDRPPSSGPSPASTARPRAARNAATYARARGERIDAATAAPALEEPPLRGVGAAGGGGAGGSGGRGDAGLVVGVEAASLRGRPAARHLHRRRQTAPPYPGAPSRWRGGSLRPRSSWRA